MRTPLMPSANAPRPVAPGGLTRPRKDSVAHVFEVAARFKLRTSVTIKGVPVDKRAPILRAFAAKRGGMGAVWPVGGCALGDFAAVADRYRVFEPRYVALALRFM